MLRYRRKAYFVEAEQWFPGKVVRGVIEDCSAYTVHCLRGPHVHCSEGPFPVRPGDWVVNGSYVYSPKSFLEFYEPVGEEGA